MTRADWDLLVAVAQPLLRGLGGRRPRRGRRPQPSPQARPRRRSRSVSDADPSRSHCRIQPDRDSLPCDPTVRIRPQRPVSSASSSSAISWHVVCYCPAGHTDCTFAEPGAPMSALQPQERRRPLDGPRPRLARAPTTSYLKATWTLIGRRRLLDQAPQGVVAARVAPGGPAAQAGVRVGDIAARARRRGARSRRRQVRASARGAAGGAPASYELLRAGREQLVELQVEPLSKGNVTPLLLPLAGRLLQPARGHDRHAAAAAGPRGAALLRDLPAVLPDVLDVVHRQAEPRRLDAALERTTSPILFLPVVFLHFCLSFPERRLAARPGLADPRRLHAGPGPGRRGGGEPGPASSTSAPTARRCGGSRPLIDRLEAALLRRAVRGLVRDPARLLPQHAQPHRAQADEVAGVGHGRRRAAVLRSSTRSRSRSAASRGWPWSWRATSRWPSSRCRSPTRWSSTG